MTMHSLIVQHHIFKYMIPFIGLMHDHQIVCDVLRVLVTALKWNKGITIEALEMMGTDGRLQMLFSEIENAKGSENTEIYTLAVMVDDIMNDREPEAERRMDVEFTFSELPPNTMRGEFSF